MVFAIVIFTIVRFVLDWEHIERSTMLRRKQNDTLLKSIGCASVHMSLHDQWGFGPGLLRRVLFDQAFVDASDENRRDSRWQATPFTSVANKLYMPTVLPTDDVQLDELGVVPLLAQIYRLCQEHAPDLEENFERVRRMSLSDQLVLKK